MATTDAPASERELVVNFEGYESRIQLDEECRTVWTKGDRVAVIYASAANEEWAYQGETGERVGHLKPAVPNNAFDGETMVAMVYPYNNYSYDVATSSFKATLPATQSYLKASYGLDGNIMAGMIGSPTTLRNVCGWLRLSIKGDGELVQSIKFRGNGGEQVAGEILVNSVDATSTLTTTASKALSEITLNCGDGVKLSTTAKTFFIALPPQTFSEGFTIEVQCDEDRVMTKSTSKSLTIDRNCISPMSAFDFEADKVDVVEEGDGVAYPTNKQVWYLTWPNGLIDVDATAFGAKVLSNEINEMCVDGLCTAINWISFDSVVTTVNPHAFEGSNLDTIYLPHSIETIAASAFAECYDLYAVHLGSGLQNIGDNAFSGGDYLTEIYCRALVPPFLGENVFYVGGSFVGADVFVPMESLAAYKSAAGWSEFADFIQGYDFGSADDDEVRTDFFHRLLLVDHTGIECKYCPSMADRLRALSLSQYASYYNEVACHGGSMTNGDPAYSDAAVVVDGFYRPNGYPALYLNFKGGQIDKSNRLSSEEFVSTMATTFSTSRKAAGADVGIAVSSSTSASKIDVNVEVTAAVSNDYRVNVWVLENGIDGSRQEAATEEWHKVYNHALRAMAVAGSKKDISGESLGTIEAKKSATADYSIALDNSWVVENLEVLVIVSANVGGSYEVVNTALCPANGVRDYEYVN